VSCESVCESCDSSHCHCSRLPVQAFKVIQRSGYRSFSTEVWLYFHRFSHSASRSPLCAAASSTVSPLPPASLRVLIEPHAHMIPLRTIAYSMSATLYVASSSSEEPSSDESSSSAASMPSSMSLSFADHLTGRCLSLALVVDGKLQPPAQLRAQIKRPIEFIKIRASPRRQRALPPLGSIFASCSDVCRSRASDWLLGAVLSW
jgi:hypothetical protein